ncbi:MAG: hypothetical protein RKP46_02855 [Candidatus Accumulibacter sp.]|uniref:hypothetical protein n=1 Tax=Accumulibacter sp. TaxID=2053492 RepID=UPI00287A4D0E|nr:hypothetical protein [Accumulibacter sp.]MDS4013278.1 hypothetical protein [Accumulibacter sp.]
MQALLSFDQAPPFAAPFRFFLTAPAFGMLAGALLLASGPDALASRWTPAALALTHLVTVGFMLQAMLGALLQIMPVVAGANLLRPLLVARLVHASLLLGACLLAGGFLAQHVIALQAAAALLAAGLLIFVTAAAHALHAVPTSSPTIRGIKLALSGLSVTTILGLLLIYLLVGEGGSELPFLSLIAVHLAWGLLGWGLVLLSSVAFVVVPMFQLTPPYSDRFARTFLSAVVGLLILWSVVELDGWPSVSLVLAGGLLAATAAFAGLTLHLQRLSKRPRFDATQQCWRVAMLSTLAACMLWLLVNSGAASGDERWVLASGILVLYGGFMTAIVGMLYKIAPFLVWLHLQNLGAGRVLAPNMNKVIPAVHIERQTLAHFLSLLVLLAAAVWPPWFAYPAGLALVAANAWLLHNLLLAVAFFRRHRLTIDAAHLKPAEQG